MNCLIKLPTHLLERTRIQFPGQHSRVVCASENFSTSGGRLVVYWTRSALRVDENPALDVARNLASQLKLPLLVYQGLSQNYSFASDRHHAFIMQAAKQLQRDFTDLNIAYAFYLETLASRQKSLVDIASLAACVVTEEMPVDPPRHFLRRLQQQAAVPILTVDTACVLPMQLVGKVMTRAFQFRDATISALQQRSGRDWVQCEAEPLAFDIKDLPFEPLNWSQGEINDWVAQCDIDHSVGPVVDTIGGSQNGYSRWTAFLQRGMKNYHLARNAAEIDGVSRMSAYLHYGMVSPFRIAREAKLQAGPGAEKFLDELLIWRELAYNFCFHRQDHDSWTALPDWAQHTLLQHQSDPRIETYDWETLARGRTADSLWNAAQQSLLRHGELHNNLRMTWGKSLLSWVQDPRTALQLIIDLNHRYALDGRDPCSYAGILWCLGQFDRPFKPEQQILGVVRPRTTTEHARRLNIDTYRRQRLQPRYSSAPKVAVIGAGVAGLMAARTLNDHGLEVQLFEKSRGLSGRAATRRVDEFQYDHGAQYFTARHPVFRRYVEAWVEQGWVKPWAYGPDNLELVNEYQQRVGATFTGASTGSLSSGVTPTLAEASPDLRNSVVVLRPNFPPQRVDPQVRYVACPGMNELGKRLGQNLNVQFGSTVTQIRRQGSQLQLLDQDCASLGCYDSVVCTAPPFQAAQLLAEFPDLASTIAKVELQPCWALMVTFDRPLAIEWAGAFLHDSAIAWISRESSKPARVRPGAYVIHATTAWSIEHLDDSPEQIAEVLLAEFFDRTGCSAIAPLHWAAHRWRYSVAQDPLSVGCLMDQSGCVYACGDWAMGSRIEGAFLAGMAAAGRILGSLQAVANSVGPTQLTLFES
jgi:photolyase PhrII